MQAEGVSSFRIAHDNVPVKLTLPRQKCPSETGSFHSGTCSLLQCGQNFQVASTWPPHSRQNGMIRRNHSII